MHQQQGHCCGSDAGNAPGLPYRRGAMIRELLPHFVGQAAHRGVVEVFRQQGVGVAALLVDFCTLAFQVTGIARLDFYLRVDLFRLLGNSSAVAARRPTTGRLVSAA